MKGPYDDIINLPRPVSAKHPRMSNLERAAQFAPFSALTGYEEAVRETARLTDKCPELDEHEKQVLDHKLRILADQQRNLPCISITYFVPDPVKDGGEYVTIRSKVKKVDKYEKVITLTNGKKIPIEKIIEINLYI